MSINRVTISGNLTRDPEVRKTGGGMAVMSFGVAVNDRRKNNQTGEWEDHPNFVDCTMFGTRAEAISRYLAKGSKVAIEGKLRFSRWQTQDGSSRSKLEVIVDEIEFLSPGRQAAQGGYNAPAAPAPAPAPAYAQPAPQAGYQAPQAAPQPQPAPQGSLYDQDIPF